MTAFSKNNLTILLSPNTPSKHERRNSDGDVNKNFTENGESITSLREDLKSKDITLTSKAHGRETRNEKSGAASNLGDLSKKLNESERIISLSKDNSENQMDDALSDTAKSELRTYFDLQFE